MRKTLYAIALTLSFFFTACSSKKEEVQVEKAEEHNPDVVEFTNEQFQTVDVRFGGVITTNLSNYIKASGTIDVPPQDLVSITSPYGGSIRSTTVIEGKYMKKGELIATIENPEFVQVQQDYLETSSQLSFLQQDLTRQEELVKENIAARKSLQKATSEYNTMNARLEGLKARLRIMNINPSSVKAGNFTSVTRIYAPTNGYITHVYSNVGKFIGPNELMADMANTNNIMIRVKVFEKDLPNIKLGQKVRFRATGDSVERTAKVFLIGKDIDTDRTVEVHAAIERLTSNMLPGMFVNAIVEIGTSSTPALPQAAVVPSGGKHYIFVEEPSKQGEQNTKTADKEKHHSFRRVEVGIGVTENGFTAVILPEKFDPKSKIVIKGAYDLLSKMNNSEEEEE
ncbi:efflux RND transporter periplasmic adaptor subunit [Sediminibacterium roseum]|uniref:Efflux RND transporter periplasmic adaptor subunit n=1 Tax=Sediminibacterium roseum TaxID=1978412 RepID=A0ABW9ZTZ5_9BACT|nr:efflux RND transporter periplasmic adaptor subunit [Sediminibacterium roseum]NCI49227.1 efflux RND transporter periplasmic adaptor subunit [Sediminibacterium roseum]TAJ60609.1 MAG: efflux RND transporter periplasmic adaptor subunit [Chitinophagaceae bacterium]